MISAQPRILIVDLNNFARYPTLSIGYLAAILRESSIHADVLSPLSTGVVGVVREPAVAPWDRWLERAKYRSAMSQNDLVQKVRRMITKTALHAPMLARRRRDVVARLKSKLAGGQYDGVFVSTYLIYYDLCHHLAKICQDRNVPMLLGGPYFAQPEVRRQWLGMPGLTGLVGGEVEPHLAEITRALVRRQCLERFQGVWASDPEKPNGPPLRDLDAVPFPDFRDFPWHKYPNRIIPLTTGRGCSWGACTFCSDVTGSIGRTFRSRSPGNVMAELEFQANRFGTRLFVFTDPKLNSNLDVWNCLLKEFSARLPGSRWLGAVHVDDTGRNGLDRRELHWARRAGMVRMTTGLESGSQRVLDLMRKGTRLATSSKAIRNAAAEDISVRVTMIVGYPGETAHDVEETASFLEDHASCIERVVLNRFHIRTGSRFHRSIEASPHAYPDVLSLSENHVIANVEHRSKTAKDRTYRRAIHRVIDVVHSINRRPLRNSARVFDGVM